jgi:hypothetical protein
LDFLCDILFGGNKLLQLANRGFFSTTGIQAVGINFCALGKVDFSWSAFIKSTGGPKFLVFTTFLISDGKGKFADLPTKRRWQHQATYC